MRTTILPLFLFLFICFSAMGQQDPAYTQYMYNLSVVNPAYATGDAGILNTGALYRSQWVGAEGAPKTGTFFIHTPISQRIQVGGTIVHDEIGDGWINEDNIYANFAYILQLGYDSYLSLGINAGVTLFSTRFNDIQLNSGDFSTDPAFAENISETYPNIGAGAFLYGDKYYVGLSAPNFLNNKHLEEQDGINSLGSEEIHVFFTGGYVFDISQNVKFKPSFMSRFVSGAPLSIDLSANFLFNEMFEGGLSYRLDDAVSAMFNVKVTPNLRLGYAYDYTTSNLGNFNSGTHEVFVLFNLDFLGLNRGYNKSPRFF
ncbi:type IX secretion system membrane protein PorP/SprF [Galbibacter sp. BG1]|uniref:PorP/SprF family type IX secretion system membrane protein n=1 Tax=Galbibacter sp. BG1 TaxID=1170699 RepID=UPI0015BFE0F8|nr:type IX secretion system membrane protein PorP/SprF [Galbibacter sp. BG1]QLE00573.1 type IX secretion system membrane protein PorP/SprF [Galbibacter sp. BG1]